MENYCNIYFERLSIQGYQIILLQVNAQYNDTQDAKDYFTDATVV